MLFRIIFAAFCLAIALIRPAAAAVVVAIDPSSRIVNPDQDLTVDVAVSGLDGDLSLSYFDLDINFDPLVLSFKGATFGDPTMGDQMDLANSGANAPTALVIAPGTLNLVELSLDSTPVLTASQASSFTLTRLIFQAAASGSSPIALTVNELVDAEGNPLGASATPGQVDITPVPLPASLLLFVSGLLPVMVWRRRLHQRAN